MTRIGHLSAVDIPFRLTNNLTLIGPPGSGKGYYGRLLTTAWKLVPLYSASQILRTHKNHRVQHPLAPEQQQQQQQQQRPASSESSESTQQQQQQQQHDSSVIAQQMNSGTLVDCEIVSQTILSFLQEHHPLPERTTDATVPTTTTTATTTTSSYYQPFILDGFPRTQQQIQYMNTQWPSPYRVTHAIHLQIPDHVCQAKMLGRRQCAVCQGAPNVAHVQTVDGFDLPPTQPSQCSRRSRSRTTSLGDGTVDSDGDGCQAQLDGQWRTRPDDDTVDVIQARLREYRLHEAALVEYFSKRSHPDDDDDNHDNSNYADARATTTTTTVPSSVLPYLCSITPYRGILDFPTIQLRLEQWLK
jgi:adenylate kinase family enzyme